MKYRGLAAPGFIHYQVPECGTINIIQYHCRAIVLLITHQSDIIEGYSLGMPDVKTPCPELHAGDRQIL